MHAHDLFVWFRAHRSSETLAAPTEAPVAPPVMTDATETANLPPSAAVGDVIASALSDAPASDVPAVSSPVAPRCPNRDQSAGKLKRAAGESSDDEEAGDATKRAKAITAE